MYEKSVNPLMSQSDDSSYIPTGSDRIFLCFLPWIWILCPSLAWNMFYWIHWSLSLVLVLHLQIRSGVIFCLVSYQKQWLLIAKQELIWTFISGSLNSFGCLLAKFYCIIDVMDAFCNSTRPAPSGSAPINLQLEAKVHQIKHCSPQFSVSS
jgi:hypothetical protein